MKNEKKTQTNKELYRLRKCFNALNVDHKKRVLKTAKGLLRIQRIHKAMTMDNTRYADFSVKGKKG